MISTEAAREAGTEANRNFVYIVPGYRPGYIVPGYRSLSVSPILSPGLSHTPVPPRPGHTPAFHPGAFTTTFGRIQTFTPRHSHHCNVHNNTIGDKLKDFREDFRIRYLCQNAHPSNPAQQYVPRLPTLINYGFNY